jgi:uncharacterized Zn finger protein
MAEPVLKIVEPAEEQTACLQCGEIEHSLLFRRKRHDIVACDRCGFAFAVAVHPGGEFASF